jgi:hypothetical protein
MEDRKTYMRSDITGVRWQLITLKPAAFKNDHHINMGAIYDKILDTGKLILYCCDLI